MPRNSQGTHSLPIGTLVSTGDTILVSQHNPAMQDISESLTNSLDRQGKGGMLANLPMNGNKVTGLANGTNPQDAATVAQLTAGTSVPIGAVIDYFGATPPTGFLFAAGQEVSRSTYAALFAVIGTAGGAGNGSTTFNLPDYRGRVGAARDNMGGTPADRLFWFDMPTSVLGAGVGEQGIFLSEAEMPAHTHAVSGAAASSGAHTHTVNGVSGSLVSAGPSGSTEMPQPSATTTSSSGAHTHTVTGTAASTGGGQAHLNVQPTIICNKIIRYI